MLVPRAYMSRQGPSGLPDAASDQANSPLASRRVINKPTMSRQAISPSHSPSPTQSGHSPANASSPVQIPHASQRPRLSASPRQQLGPPNRPASRDMPQGNRISSASGATVDSLLSSTAIPTRRRPPRNISQKLPHGDHVAAFSRLLLEDVAGPDARLPSNSSSISNPHLEELFGPSAESTSAPRIGPDGTTFCSIRSMSCDSMPSLLTDDDTADPSVVSDSVAPSSPSQRLSPNPRVSLLSSSEECGENHPLQQMNVLDPLPSKHEVDPPLQQRRYPAADVRSRSSSLRSNLTASLRALRSAAQTVSSLASTSTHLTQPDDFITRSIFSFAPQLTDDKRPPPSFEPPSPALRRYLNPHQNLLESSSPADFHSYHEPRTSSRTTKQRPRHSLPSRSRTASPPIQLQTCIPSPNRSAHASSPPTWLNPDGSHSTRTSHPSSQSPSTAIPPSPSPSRPTPPTPPRQREPRENAAFLRILVAEMNMRRCGKFDDDMHSHACVWLPPRKTVDVSIAGADDGGGGAADGHVAAKTPSQRWVGLSVDLS